MRFQFRLLAALFSANASLRRRGALLGACFGALACCASAAATPLGIDDFRRPAAIFFAGPATMSQRSSSILGGQRDLTVAVMGAAVPTSVVGMVGSDDTRGYPLSALQVGMAGEAGSVVTLQYSGKHDTPGNAYALGGNPGTPLDLTSGGKYDSF